jgi:NADPH:quinone reductase-like Zn-dependent oxidoreductase
MPAAADDTGWTGTPVVFPLIQGADACGEIVAVGTGISPGRLGERVLIDPVLRPPPDSPGSVPRYLGSDCHGTFAEFVAVPAMNAVPVRSALSDAELASFPCAYSTAENLLTRARVSSGDTVLVTGASGGVGTAAVQLARRRGARIIAVAAAEKAAAIRALGAAEVVARGEELRARLAGEPIDAVIDVVGGSSFAALLGVLRHGGRYAVAGAIGGALVTLDLRTLYLKDLSMYGCTISDPAVFANLVRYIQNGEITAVVARTFALQDLAAAQRAFLEKAHVGKIVILM